MEQESEPQALGSDAGAAKEERKKRRKPRWGAETEAGLKVLETVQVPAGGVVGHGGGALDASGPAAPPPPQPNARPPATTAEPAPKKQRSRWEDAPAPPPVAPLPAVAGQIVLPDAIAALVKLQSDPAVLELQAQLRMVRCCRRCLLRLFVCLL